MSSLAPLTLGAIEGLSLTQDEKRFIQNSQPAGVTLFSRNIHDPRTLEEIPLARELQSLRFEGLPFIVALDQEGGQVARLKAEVLDPGPAFALERKTPSPESLLSIETKAMAQGKKLREMGVNVNFAPVVDVGFEKEKQDLCFLGDRVFGSSSEEVIARGTSFLRGLQRAGVFGCLKHYPGLGKIKADTHLEEVLSQLTEEGLRQEALVPFAKMHHEAEMIMVAHGTYPKISPVQASRSSFFMTDLLRKELRFEGLVLCDDLNMKAVPQEENDWKAFVVESFAAGCDLLLVCRGLERWQLACHALELEQKKSPAFAKRVAESLVRLQRFRQKLPI